MGRKYMTIPEKIKRKKELLRQAEGIMEFKKNKWYKTSDGYEVEFITPIEKDGMYNVFRLPIGEGFGAYFTDKDGKTAYGARIVSPV